MLLCSTVQDEMPLCLMANLRPALPGAIPVP
jgi:hypothetical protein